MSTRVLGLPALGQRCISTSVSASYAGADDIAKAAEAKKNPSPYISKSIPTPGTSPAAAKAASNAWLLHPWLPIDVRIPIVLGVGIASGYVYLSSSGQLQEFEDRWKKAGLPTELPQSVKDMKWAESLPTVDSMKATLGGLSLPAVPALPALPEWLQGKKPAASKPIHEPGFSMTSGDGHSGEAEGVPLRPCPANSASSDQHAHPR